MTALAAAVGAAGDMNIYDTLLDSLTNDPDSWTFGEYTADHKSGIDLWTANGFISFHVERPFYLAFNPLKSWRLWRAIRKCRKRQICLMLKAITAAPSPAPDTGA